MKRTILILPLILAMNLTPAQHLVTGNADPIGLENWAYSPMLVEAGPDHFFLLSGSYYTAVDHPFLKEVHNDFATLFFIKYDGDGKPVASNHIRGAYSATRAFSFKGGLTIVASAGEDVDAGGRQIPVNQANNLEFMAAYDPGGRLVDIVSIWNLSDQQSAYSVAAMDPGDGSVVVYGNREDQAEVAGYGVIGKEWPGRYMYVIKYSRDLQLQWVYTAGFDRVGAGYGYYNELRAVPDGRGGVVLTGAYEASVMQPVFGDVKLPQFPDGMGLFAVSLDADGQQSWVQEGGMKGYGNGTCIHEGMALPGGDMLLAGVTTTGYFQLGDAVFSFEDGMGYANQFAYRMRPDGSVVWSAPFRTMGKSESQDKKSARSSDGTKSDAFTDNFYYDAHLWNDRILYLTGTFLSDSLTIAGRQLDRRYSEGVFVASVDVETGEEVWGYGMSSDWIGLNGFDADGSGNITLMGHTGDRMEYGGFGPDSVPGKDLLFFLGLSFTGDPLWYNNMHLDVNSFGLHGADLEVLPAGEVFTSVYTTRSDNIMVAGDPIASVPTYASWVISLVPGTELGGVVTRPDDGPAFPGYVLACKTAASGRFPVVDSVRLDESGRYLFTGLYPGNYTFLAVPDRETDPLSVPTYLGDRPRWKDARFIDIEPDTRASFLDIILARVPVFGPEDGNGTLSGNVSYEEVEVLKGTLGRPVKKASVILIEKSTKKTSGEVVAYVETDDLGSYVFENVPDGDYLLIVEITGLEMIETHEVRIEGNMIVSGLDYTVGEDGIYTWGGVGIEPDRSGQLRLFPNPGNGRFFLELTGDRPCHAEVFGSDGRLVHRHSFSPGAETGMIDISACDPGIYLIRLVTSGRTSVTRYILQ